MNRPVLDLTVRHFTRELGDLTVIGTWYGADLKEMEPVLCLVPTYRALFDGTARARGRAVSPCHRPICMMNRRTWSTSRACSAGRWGSTRN